MPTKIVRYEAENAVREVNGPTFSTSYPGYSGTGSMYFNGTGGTGINFTVTCSKAGNYPLTIRYLIPSGWGDKQNDVLVNGSLIWSPNFTNTNSTWASFAFGNISLNAGSNIVRIQHNWGWFYVDYIEIAFPRTGNFKDFADFGQQWKHANCGPANNWCSGFDFSQDGSVLLDDFKSFAESWLSNI